MPAAANDPGRYVSALSSRKVPRHFHVVCKYAFKLRALFSNDGEDPHVYIFYRIVTMNRLIAL